MITAKKSNAGIVCIIIAVILFLIGILSRNGLIVFWIAMSVLLVIAGVSVMVTSSKNYKKKLEWIERANADGTIDRINNSVANGTASYYNKLKLTLTPYEVVSDSPSEPIIIKYEDIAKAYRSNINGDQYDYNYQHICLDLKTGQRINVAVVPRARIPEEFGSAIASIKRNITTEGGLQ
jgi:predicted membrane protein